jgi:hypothetical protein
MEAAATVGGDLRPISAPRTPEVCSTAVSGAKVPGKVKIGHDLLESPFLVDLEHVGLRIVHNVLAECVIVACGTVVDDLSGLQDFVTSDIFGVEASLELGNGERPYTAYVVFV